MSEPVRSFLGARIGSYEQLDALLLLYANSTRQWTAREVAAALRVDEQLAAEALRELRDHDLVDETGEVSAAVYRCSANEELCWLIGLVARAYAENHVDIVRYMSANAIERMRAAAAANFADAFLLRRPPNG